jgi:acyl carrier protein
MAIDEYRATSSQSSKPVNRLDRIRGAVYQTVDAVNDLLPSEQALDAADDLVLIGSNAKLDSMGFVNFIVALEEELEREFGCDLRIGDLLDMQNGDGNKISTIADLIKVLSERLE